MKDGGSGGSRRRRVHAQRLAMWSQYSIHTLVRQGEDRLILRATNLVRGIAITLVVCGAVIFLGRLETSIIDPVRARESAMMIGSLLILLGWAMWLAPPRVVFDRHSRRVLRRHWLWRSEYAWKEIIAVQTTHGGGSDQELDSSPAQPATRELKLVLGPSCGPGVPLTNHADDRTTEAMAADIARFLNVPLWDELQHEVRLPATADVISVSNTVAGAWMTRLGRLRAVGYVSALGSLFFALCLSIGQSRLEELEASAVPIRARLVAMETKEWIEGHNNWYARGLFDVESVDHRGRAEGNLIPESFYRQHHLRGPGNVNRVPQPVAASFLSAWEIGKTYNGYLYADAPEYIFFELPGAKTNALTRRTMLSAAGVFFLLGVFASVTIDWIKRRQPSVHAAR